MKNVLAVIMVLMFSVFSVDSLSYANKTYLVYHDVPGYWFDEPTTDLMLKDLSELSLLQEKKIPELDTKIRLQEILISKYKVQLAVSEKISDKYEDALEKSEKNYDALEARYRQSLGENSRWYRSPSFLFIVGIISGGLLAIGLSYGMQGAD